MNTLLANTRERFLSFTHLFSLSICVSLRTYCLFCWSADSLITNMSVLIISTSFLELSISFSLVLHTNVCVQRICACIQFLSIFLFTSIARLSFFPFPFYLLLPSPVVLSLPPTLLLACWCVCVCVCACVCVCMCMCVYVYVYVCVWGREREGENERECVCVTKRVPQCVSVPVHASCIYIAHMHTLGVCAASAPHSLSRTQTHAAYTRTQTHARTQAHTRHTLSTH